MGKREMDDKVDSLNHSVRAVRKRQAFVGGIIVAVVGLLLLALFHVVDGQDKSKASHKEKSATKTTIQHPVDKSALQTNWQDVINKKMDKEEAAASKLNEELKQLKDINTAQQGILQEQRRELQVLRQQFLLLEKETPVQPIDQFNERVQANPSHSLPALLQINDIALVTKEKHELPKTAHNYVPAGSFIEAILLGGLDAHAGVHAQSDPHPVLMRVLDNGVLPNNRNSQLENCRLIGAGYGDISSERAYIRLERMSCEQKGFFTDYPVYGYVTGPDGKDGIRGRVVIRDKDVVSRAFIGGFLGGLSDGATQSFTTQSISPLGSIETVKSTDILAYSGAEGVGNAMELYARYNIKRAEMYQPVIEIPAGTKVNVVFNRGFYLDGLSVNDPGKLTAAKTHETFLIESKELNYEPSNLLVK